jgi:hypothetical protein
LTAKRTLPPELAEAGKATQFKPGEGGRPKGSRNKLGEAFISALQADFREHGDEAIRRTREEKPAEYIKVLAGILPKEIEIRRPLEDLSDDELVNAIELIRASIGADPEGVGIREDEAPRGKPH